MIEEFSKMGEGSFISDLDNSALSGTGSATIITFKVVLAVLDSAGDFSVLSTSYSRTHLDLPTATETCRTAERLL